MKYDDASWHYGGDFPEGLEDAAGATHIGMFVAWAVLSGLAGEIHTREQPDMLDKLRRRDQTPGAWFIAACDEKFTAEDLTEEGNDFALAYYAGAEGLHGHPDAYLADYAETFAEHDNLYAVSDSWPSFDRLKPVLDKRFAEWKSPRPRGWRQWFK